ncbi:MAG: M23 family metallopeptidase [Bacteroides sp.]|nr:MAG: M23 family metallopeptidase [Bacteroides sp.]
MTNSIPAIQPISNKNLKRIASGYGLRMHPVYKIYKMHYGVDFVAPTGTKIYSTGNGIIKDININRSYGLCVVINHGYGYKTLYAHMSKVIVRKNQIVNRGDIIGLVGNSGLSTGSHLHYEVYKNGKNVDPALFFFNDISPDQYDEMIKVSKKFPLSFD